MESGDFTNINIRIFKKDKIDISIPSLFDKKNEILTYKEKHNIIKYVDKPKQFYISKTINDNIQYEDIIKNAVKEKNHSFENNYHLNKYKKEFLILDNGYILLLVNIIDYRYLNHDNKNHQILVLINPDNNNYKKLLELEKGKLFNIFPVYKNIFLLANIIFSSRAFLSGSIDNIQHLNFFEFFPKNENTELICSISDKKLRVIDCFEFSSKICILFTEEAILFYKWNKNEIIRKFKFQFKNISSFREYEYFKFILVNKIYFVGISTLPSKNTILFIYNFASKKLLEYMYENRNYTNYDIIKMNEKYFLFLKGKNFMVLEPSYNGYFIIYEGYTP